jgi:acetyl esterase
MSHRWRIPIHMRVSIVSEPSLDLDPAIVEWAAHIAEIATMLPGLTSSDMQARRAAERVLSDKLAREYTEEQVPGVLIHAVTIATAIGRLRIRRYRPVDLPDLAPTELFLHGGGFISGSVDELINDRLLTRRAHDARLQVISVDYRLAPEHPYPAAVDDVIAVLDVVREQPERFGVDVLRIGIGGVSAGAGIAASAALHLRDRGDDVLIHQSLEVPAVALRAFGLSAVKYARGYGLDGYQDLAALYLGEAGRQASTAQPLFAPELSGLPSAFIRLRRSPSGSSSFQRRAYRPRSRTRLTRPHRDTSGSSCLAGKIGSRRSSCIPPPPPTRLTLGGRRCSHPPPWIQSALQHWQTRQRPTKPSLGALSREASCRCSYSLGWE